MKWPARLRFILRPCMSPDSGWSQSFCGAERNVKNNVTACTGAKRLRSYSSLPVASDGIRLRTAVTSPTISASIPFLNRCPRADPPAIS
jgi:hypothetical protein